MTSEQKPVCEEKPPQPEEEIEDKNVMVTLAVALGVTMLIAGSLDLFFKGLPLGFVIPVLNEQATVSVIVYRVIVTAIAIYIGYIGIRELVVERRFSVEFLMAVAA